MIKKLYNNLLNSINGLKVVIKENSFILELILGFFLVPYIFLSNIDYNQKVVLFILYCLLLAFETMNTAIEKLCNKLTTDFDPKIRDIKDLSSAAVFIILIVLIIIFLITLPNNFLS
ncbi:diacylglycerol kinase [Candidatus Pelagibacter bacterium]|nr:diacylglycerol kinase [Candidatus Pelagibacter bacterium]